MTNDSNGSVPKDLLLSARRAWLERGKVDQLPEPVRRVYDSRVYDSGGCTRSGERGFPQAHRPR